MRSHLTVLLDFPWHSRIKSPSSKTSTLTGKSSDALSFAAIVTVPEWRAIFEFRVGHDEIGVAIFTFELAGRFADETSAGSLNLEANGAINRASVMF